VECIGKGKAHKAYEFGVKVSIATTIKEQFVVSSLAIPGNPYDGHTLKQTLEALTTHTGRPLSISALRIGVIKEATRQPMFGCLLRDDDLVVLDELGYVPFSQNDGALLFHLLNKLYEKNQRHYHHQPELQRMAQGVWRCKDDHSTVGPTHPSLSYHRDRQQQLSV
jgi:hypothetical protein